MDQSADEKRVATDSELVMLVRRGDLDAFEELVTRHHARLISFLRFFSSAGTDIEGVAQETFLKCFTHLGQFDTKRSFKNWLYTIARRSIPKSRPVGWVSGSNLEEVVGPDIDPSGELESSERRQSIWATVRSVTGDDEFQLIWFRYAEQFSFKEIALVMRRSEAACKMQLSRLRKRLKPHLQPFVQPESELGLFDNKKRTA